MSKQGLIYEIVCNLTGERYIGSTFQPTIAKRIAQHRNDIKTKKNACCSKIIIERGDYRYGLLETIQVNSRDEIRMCERKWYDTLECINKRLPYATELEIKQKQKQYCEDHKEEIKQYHQDHIEELTQYQKQYRQDHKEEIKQYHQDHREELNQKRRDKYAAAKALK